MALRTHGKHLKMAETPTSESSFNEAIRLTRIKCNQNFLSSSRALISRDKRLAICGCGNRLLVYSVKTGKHLRTLEGHKADVIDYYLRIKNSLQLISADKSGAIVLWDITDGTLMKKVAVPHSISALLMHPTNDDLIYVVKRGVKEKKSGKVKPSNTLVKVDLSKPMQRKSKENEVALETLCEVAECSKSIAFSQNGNVIAYINGSKLHIISLKDQYKRSYGFKGKCFTSIAFHPSKMMIATGTVLGKIVLWSNFLDGKMPTAIQLQWHVHPVNAVSFTNDGLYLLSGGLENVLVIWQLASQNKDFLPRMGAQINCISLSKDDNFVLVTLSNNVVKILSLVDKHLTSTLQGLSEVSNGEVDIRVDPRSGCVVVPIIPDGQLQFYNPDKDSVLKTFDVVGHNYIIGPGRDASTMSQIDHFDFSDDGLWLATIEHGKYKLIPDEIKLKFWYFDVNAQKYQMVTMAETPHGNRISCLRLRPRSESSAWNQMAITTDRGGKMKFWVIGDSEDTSDLSSWKCLSACSHGSSSCSKAEFSRDGSLLAAIYGKEITIWDSETRKLRTSFYSPVKDKFRDVIFGAGSSDPFLLTRTSNYILCWNLLSCTMSWSIQATVTAMAVDPFSGYFAVFDLSAKGKSQLCLLDVSTSKVVFQMEKNGKNFTVNSLAFSSTEAVTCKTNGKVQKIGKLYALSSNKDIYRYSPKVEETNDDTEFESLEEQVSSEFANIFGNIEKRKGEDKTSVDIQDSFRTVPGKHSAAVVRKIIGTPSHVLPSVTSLSSTFFKAVTLMTSPELSESKSDEERESSEAEDNEGSGTDEELVTDKDRNMEITQENVLTMETDLRNSSEQIERTIKVDFTWISNFMSSNYDS